MDGLFLSDLHLFSRRSIGQGFWDSLRRTISQIKLLVLGGDIFDFRWSQHRDLPHSLDAAMHWLEHVLSDYPKLYLAYVLGNHDSHPAMQARLTILATEQPRFRWDEYQWRLGSHLFLHGDEIDAGSFDFLPQYRAPFHDHRPRGKVANLAYDAAVRARLHLTVPALIQRPADVCRWLSQSIESRSLGAEQGIEHVYFGHTHQTVDRMHHQGQWFYNPGAAIKYCRFNCVPFELPANWLEQFRDQPQAAFTPHLLTVPAPRRLER